MLIRIFHRSIFIALLISLSGCKVGPNYHLPGIAVFNNPAAAGDFVSAKKSTFSNESVPEKWWYLYNDPTLNQLVEEAICANTDLRVAVANLELANAELKEAKSMLYPTTNLLASYTSYHVSAETFDFTPPIPSLPFVKYLNEGGGIVLPIDFFGKIRRGIESAKYDRQAAQAARDLALITVVAETTSAYTDMCAAGYQLNIAEHLLKIQAQTTALTKRLESGGRATALDVSQSNSELDQIRADIPRLKTASRNALFRLAQLTGRVPAEIIPIIQNCNSLPKIKCIIPVGDGARLLCRRPDIREAERKLAAATATIGVETANLYPDITFRVLGDWLGHPRDTLQRKTFVWNTGPFITWTFPNVSVARSRIAEAKASTRAEFAKFDGVVLKALKEVESNLTTYANDLDNCKDLKLAYKHSRTAFLQAKLLYLNGRENYLKVLEAEQTFTNVSALLAVAESKLATDQINLFLSLGGGWN